MAIRLIFGFWDDETNNLVRFEDGTPVMRKTPQGWVEDDVLPSLLEVMKFFPSFNGLVSSINTSGCNTSLPVTPIPDAPVDEVELTFEFGQHYEPAPDEVAPYLVKQYILVVSKITEGTGPVQAVLMEQYSNGVERAYTGVVNWDMPTRPNELVTIGTTTGIITVPLDSISADAFIGIRATFGSSEKVETPVQLINVSPANPAPKVGNPMRDVLITTPGVFSFTLPADQFYDPGDTGVLTVFRLNADGTLSALPYNITFNSATRTFTGPADLLQAAFPIRVGFTDSAGQTATDDFLLTVDRQAQNRPPVLVKQLPNQTITGGQAAEIPIPADTFNDPDGDPLTLATTQNAGQALPNGLIFDVATRTLKVPAAYPYPSQLALRTRASDPAGLYADMYYLLVTKAPAANNVIQNLLVELPVGWRNYLPTTNTYSENVKVYAKVSNNFGGKVQMRYVQSRFQGSADWGDMFPLASNHPLRAQGYTHSFFYNDEQFSGRTNPFNQFVARLDGVSGSDVIGQFNVATSAQDGEKYLIYPVNS